MDLKLNRRVCQLLLTCTAAGLTGCLAQTAAPTAATGLTAGSPRAPTLWQRLGIRQASTRAYDGLVNRRGNFPGLERKPPVLALADPANLDPGKPDMIKAAAEIKQDQDLKKQKIKALKFLAEVNCGCYNKDDKVEAAFLAALEDCDPDVRTAAIEGLSVAAGECTRCRDGCETTCCTKKIQEKLDDIANGVEDGCFKEPVEEIRKAARALFCKCPPVAEDPIEPEELIAPNPEPLEEEGPRELIEGDEGAEPVEAQEAAFNLSDLGNPSKDVVGATHLTAGHGHSFSLSDMESSRLSSKPPQAKKAAHPPKPTDRTIPEQIVNPEQMVASQAVAYREALGELLIQMPDAFELDTGWVAIVVDSRGKHSLAKIIDVGGRRVLLAVDDPRAVEIQGGENVRLGLVRK